MSTAVDPIEAYWMGAMYADGCIHKNKRVGIRYVSLVSADEDFVRKYADYMGCLDRCYLVKGKYWRVNLRDDRFSDRASLFGVVPGKSNNWHAPSIRMSVAEVWCFLRGLMDGDGCITGGFVYGDPSLHRANVEWLANPVMSTWVADFLDSQGIKFSVYKKSEKLRKVSVWKRSQVKVLEWLYKDVSAEVSMDRKRRKALKLVERLKVSPVLVRR